MTRNEEEEVHVMYVGGNAAHMFNTAIGMSSFAVLTHRNNIGIHNIIQGISEQYHNCVVIPPRDEWLDD